MTTTTIGVKEANATIAEKDATATIGEKEATATIGEKEATIVNDELNDDENNELELNDEIKSLMD